MRTGALALIACALAAVAPLVPRPDPAASAAAPFTWPSHFQGRPLTPIALGERDARFARDFPGQVARFSDGTREIILRFTTRATRRLHPASDCMRAVGFAIDPLPLRRGPDGAAWGCFRGRRADLRLFVCEQIRDSGGQSWPDPSSWYWPALLGRSAGPWWSTTTVEADAP
jgi:hypothetical protein